MKSITLPFFVEVENNFLAKQLEFADQIQAIPCIRSLPRETLRI